MIGVGGDCANMMIVGTDVRSLDDIEVSCSCAMAIDRLMWVHLCQKVIVRY